MLSLSKHLSRFVELLIRSGRDASTSGRQMSMTFQHSFEYFLNSFLVRYQRRGLYSATQIAGQRRQKQLLSRISRCTISSWPGSRQRETRSCR